MCSELKILNSLPFHINLKEVQNVLGHENWAIQQPTKWPRTKHYKIIMSSQWFVTGYTQIRIKRSRPDAIENREKKGTGTHIQIHIHMMIDAIWNTAYIITIGT